MRVNWLEMSNRWRSIMKSKIFLFLAQGLGCAILLNQSPANGAAAAGTGTGAGVQGGASATNFVSVTNRTGLAPNDMAASEFDRILIVQVRQRLYLKDPGTSGSWNMINFASQGGNMLVSGQVAQLADKENLIVVVRNTP